VTHVVGEPSDQALRELLDERVHLLIRVNLVENSTTKNDELGRILAKRVNALDKRIADRRCAVSLCWQIRELPKISRSE
jgi:hypothetical protein